MTTTTADAAALPETAYIETTLNYRHPDFVEGGSAPRRDRDRRRPPVFHACHYPDASPMQVHVSHSHQSETERDRDDNLSDNRGDHRTPPFPLDPDAFTSYTGSGTSNTLAEESHRDESAAPRSRRK